MLPYSISILDFTIFVAWLNGDSLENIFFCKLIYIYVDSF